MKPWQVVREIHILPIKRVKRLIIMGNSTNEKQWAAVQRLRFVEQSAYWRGTVNRQDLMETFGVSPAQATADLQKFQELCPGVLHYNLKRKRYESRPDMACRLHEPQLEEALTRFLGASLAGPAGLVQATEVPAAVATVVLPRRAVPATVVRAVFLAVLHGLRLRVRYQSLSGKAITWRWLRPHAFGHDGYRWHVRAWSEESELFLDFVLGRIVEVEWPEEAAPLPEPDADWDTWEELVLQPRADLGPEQRAAVLSDYAMTDDRLVLRVRRAMVDYTLAHLRLPLRSGNELGPVLEAAET